MLQRHHPKSQCNLLAECTSNVQRLLHLVAHNVFWAMSKTQLVGWEGDHDLIGPASHWH